MTTHDPREDREKLVENLAAYKKRRAVLGEFRDGWDDFESVTRREAESLDDLELKKLLDSSLEEVNESGGQLARLKHKAVRETFAARIEWLTACCGETTRTLEASLPPVLAEAIKRMESALEFCRNLGTSKFCFSVGGDLLTSAKGRTPSDEAATQRVEIALQRLRSLAVVLGPLEPQIAAIVAEADLGGIWAALPNAPPPPVVFDKRRDKLRRESIADDVAAVIVPDDAPRERLLPVG